LLSGPSSTTSFSAAGVVGCCPALVGSERARFAPRTRERQGSARPLKKFYPRPSEPRVILKIGQGPVMKAAVKWRQCRDHGPCCKRTSAMVSSRTAASMTDDWRASQLVVKARLEFSPTRCQAIRSIKGPHGLGA
jgi:hypothetical protein